MARSTIRALAAVFAVGSLLTATAVARADEKTDSQKGYGYHFDDDLLEGLRSEGHTPRITVIQKGLRQRLMRPRTQFVTEMLRSVDHL